MNYIVSLYPHVNKLSYLVVYERVGDNTAMADENISKDNLKSFIEKHSSDIILIAESDSIQSVYIRGKLIGKYDNTKEHDIVSMPIFTRDDMMRRRKEAQKDGYRIGYAEAKIKYKRKIQNLKEKIYGLKNNSMRRNEK